MIQLNYFDIFNKFLFNIFLFVKKKALNVVFGSLYLDEVTLDSGTVVSVLATAALLQLDGLIDQCAEVMNSTINAEVNTIWQIPFRKKYVCI